VSVKVNGKEIHQGEEILVRGIGRGDGWKIATCLATVERDRSNEETVVLAITNFSNGQQTIPKGEIVGFAESVKNEVIAAVGVDWEDEEGNKEEEERIERRRKPRRTEKYPEEKGVFSVEKEKEKEKETGGSTPDEEISEEDIEKMVETVDVPKSEKEMIKNIIRKNRDRFCNELRKPGSAAHFLHRIITTTDMPITGRMPRRSQEEHKVVDEHAAKLCRQGVIRPSVSPWSAPVVLAKKKDGTWRFCVDFRRLNAVTQKDRYPLPRVDESLDALGKAKYLTTFDLTQGYWQIPLAEEDKHKSAFSTRGGHYEFNVLAMGLTNSGPTFQRNMEIILSGLNWKSCLVYVDDIIIFSATFEQHMKDIEAVLQRLREANLQIRTSKCQFCRKEMPYLGHIVSQGKVKLDPAKVEVIRNWKEPKTVSDLRAFVGLASYYC